MAVGGSRDDTIAHAVMVRQGRKLCLMALAFCHFNPPGGQQPWSNTRQAQVQMLQDCGNRRYGAVGIRINGDMTFSGA